MFWMASCGAGLPARPETLRFRPLACELFERAELVALFSQHVASGIRRGQFSPHFRAGESADAFCGSPSGACAERVRVLGLRRFGGRAYRLAGRPGTADDLASARRADAT